MSYSTAQQLLCERQYVLQETNTLLLQIESIPRSQEGYADQVHSFLQLFKLKIDKLFRNEFAACSNDVILSIFSQVDTIQALGRLSQTCKRFRSLISSHRDAIWQVACLAWWNKNVRKKESYLIRAHKFAERDWEWIARSFAKDERNSLSHTLCEPFRFSFGLMRDGELRGWGIEFDNVVQIGHFHGTLLYGKQVERSSVYEGQFMNGRRDGWGTETMDDGSTLHGEWKNGELHGTITMTYVGGEVGGFPHEKRQEPMQLMTKDGFYCEGTFTDGLPDGNLASFSLSHTHADREKFVHPAVKECIAQGACTKTLSKRMPQFFLKCTDCKVEACVVCAEHCHSGHELEELFWIGRCFCDDKCSRRIQPALKKSKLS